MIFTISVLLVVTVTLAAFVLAPRIREERVLYDSTPDRPAPFGCSMAWLAVKTTDVARVAEILHLHPIEKANWNSGIGTVYDARLSEQHVYMTPPLDGWIFVVGLSLPQPMGPAFVDKCTPVLLDLAAAFPQAHYYLSYPPLDCYAWARVSDGKLVRAFAVGDEGMIWNKGRVSKEERGLGLRLTEMRNGRGRRHDTGPIVPICVTEAHVMHLAGCWSLDPTLIGTVATDGSLGLICRTPAHWKPERMRRAG